MIDLKQEKPPSTFHKKPVGGAAAVRRVSTLEKKVKIFNMQRRGTFVKSINILYEKFLRSFFQKATLVLVFSESP